MAFSFSTALAPAAGSFGLSTVLTLVVPTGAPTSAMAGALTSGTHSGLSLVAVGAASTSSGKGA